MTMKLNSPRGWLRFDQHTQQSYGPAYLLSADHDFKLQIEKTDEDTSAERNIFIATKPAGEASGWRNTYLCS
jgi:hypothetical protein